MTKPQREPTYRLPSPRILAAISFAFAFLLYANTIPNGYSIDDESVTRGHHATSRGLAALPEIFTTSHMKFAGQEFDYRPLTLATFALENQLVGDDPHVSHFINVLLYASTAVVLFGFLHLLLGTEAIALCFVATLLFVAHALHTEVVASLKNREELLVLLFGLLSARSFLRYFDRGRPIHAAAGAAAFLLALMSKLSALPLAALIPLSIAFRQPGKLRQAAALAIALIAGSIAYERIVLSFVPTLMPIPDYVENPLVSQSDWLLRAGTGLGSLLFYLEKLFVPYPLSFYYGYDTIRVESLLSWRAGISVAVHSALALYAILHARARNAAAFGIAWYLISIAPYSNLLVLAKGIVAERSAYMASVGFALAVVYVIVRFVGRDARAAGRPAASRRPVAATAGALLTAYAFLTVDRNRDWADGFGLYEADLPHLERSVMAHQIYARELRREFGPAAPSPERTEKLERAIALSERAREILPTYASADAHIGAIYLYDLNRPADALPYLARASELAPHYAPAHYDALFCSVQLGRFDDAFQFAERLLRRDPNHVMGLYYIAKLRFKAGDIDGAFADNDRLAGLAPDRDLPYLNYAYFYLDRGDADRAIQNFERALAIAPDNPAVIADLVGILTDRGQLDKAERYGELAKRLESGHSD